jgi:hypothetical protein
LQTVDDSDALLEAARNRLRELIAAAEGLLVAVRMEFTGRCRVHAQLANDAARQRLTADIRALASDFGDDVWIEKIRFRTQSSLDLDAMRDRQDLLGQLLRDVAALVAVPGALPMLPEAKDLAAKVAAELALDTDGADAFDLDDPTRQVAWLRDAEALLLSHLVPASGDPS